MDLVSIVIVHWGDPVLTRQVVSSVKSGTNLVPQQIIVVENGEDSEISPEEARVIPLPRNRGYAAGVNAGIRAAFHTDAQYIAVANNDLQYCPGVLEAMLKYLPGSSGRIGCVGAVINEGDGKLIYGGGYVSWFRGRTKFVSRPNEGDKLQYISGAFFLITRQCVEDIGLLPEHYFHLWEDVDYGFRMRKKGWSLSWVNTPVLYHSRSRSMKDVKLKTYYLVRNGSLFVRAHAPHRVKKWLLGLEPLRELKARRAKRWEIVRALRDARIGVTGPLPDNVNLECPP